MNIGQMLAEKSLAKKIVTDSYFLPRYDETLYFCSDFSVFAETKTGRLTEYKRLSEMPDGIQNEFWHGIARRIENHAAN